MLFSLLEQENKRENGFSDRQDKAGDLRQNNNFEDGTMDQLGDEDKSYESHSPGRSEQLNFDSGTAHK